MKITWGTKRARRNPTIVLQVLRKGHRIDPDTAPIYATLTNLRKKIRLNQELKHIIEKHAMLANKHTAQGLKDHGKD